ncbi:hypothetical protein [Microbacterium sp. G2-8]|uniref:hypothetical protein n=1 Tax=Microbacterium sp. G2-8 TaxID=2842454 RepID=UPI001C8A8FF9|nr:hypothetical protein [Microbacterium sp. G2-8]
MHFATCPAYGADDPDGTCTGCAPVDARDGALVCHRCYGKLRRRLETAPEIAAHLRRLARTGGSAKRYDRESHGRMPRRMAPVDPDVLDALRDVLDTLNATATADATPDEVHEIALGAAGAVLADYDAIVNDAGAFATWWQVTMPTQLPDWPEFWTIARAFARWPLEDRSGWAALPCPGCDLRMLRRIPPARAGVPEWYVCSSCEWERNDTDDDGLWALVIADAA